MVFMKKEKIIIVILLVILSFFLYSAYDEIFEQINIENPLINTNSDVNEEEFNPPIVETEIEIPFDVEGLSEMQPDLNKQELQNLELLLHNKINEVRQNYSLPTFNWDENITNVARNHSIELAKINEELTQIQNIIHIPLIYHEGFTTGTYHNDRLYYAEIYNHDLSAENIAIYPIFTTRSYKITSENDDDYPKFERVDTSTAKNQEELLLMIKNEIGSAKNHVKTFGKEFEFSYEGIKTADELLDSIVIGWMNSPGHRENILNPKLTYAGIGIAQVNDYIIATQVFVTKIQCGYKNGNCCEKKGYYPYCLEGLKCEDVISNKIKTKICVAE